MDEEGIAQELILDSESETHISEDEILWTRRDRD